MVFIRLVKIQPKIATLICGGFRLISIVCETYVTYTLESVVKSWS